MNTPRQSTTFPRWLVLAIGVTAMMSGTGATAGQHEAVSPEQREELQKREQAAEDPEALAEEAEDAGEAKPQESWISGLPTRDQDWEDTDKIDEAAAERAGRQRAARQEEDAASDIEPVPDETVEQIIETRREGASGSGPAQEEADNDEDDADGPPDRS
ncbi:hypothetical protein [Wenzhouxiangella sp. XN24]|uniref:hypothetical protein n=1 Tax=Wenzhouxiangella sp. XN24 TaxID=2713569 RepID=UPI0013EC9C0A|nr:hypothetical protein [Wenzhouxiangella sp. XN24]NGX15354.1 hypothetical protein [Wenzhouxiangella sp. XN24]